MADIVRFTNPSTYLLTFLLTYLLLQSVTRLTQETCDNIGGYYSSTVDISNSTTAATPAQSLPILTATVDRCYYHTFDCPGHIYQDQCYSNKSSSLSCPTCNNIGGMYSTSDTCYYNSNDCAYFSAAEQCHTNRCYKRLFRPGRQVLKSYSSCSCCYYQFSKVQKSPGFVNTQRSATKLCVHIHADIPHRSTVSDF